MRQWPLSLPDLAPRGSSSDFLPQNQKQKELLIEGGRTIILSILDEVPDSDGKVHLKSGSFFHVLLYEVRMYVKVNHVPNGTKIEVKVDSSQFFSLRIAERDIDITLDLPVSVSDITNLFVSALKKRIPDVDVVTHQ